ncbi:MAG: hypothetical protein WBH85_16115 [Thermoanaerobaculia bacterium]
MSRKTQQLQIRVSPGEKRAIRYQARRAGQDLSAYVLARVLPAGRVRFAEILRGIADDNQHRFWLAELNDLLAGLAPVEFGDAVEAAELEGLSTYLQNYVAAMVEQAAHQKDVEPPSWVREVEPLEEPHFAVPFAGLRAHLLRAAPVAFKRRNLFVDSSIGDRV